jgi:hypothetical protein
MCQNPARRQDVDEGKATANAQAVSDAMPDGAIVRLWVVSKLPRRHVNGILEDSY